MKRDQTTTDTFIEGIRQVTVRSGFQITTNGFAPYKNGIRYTLHDRCDFASIVERSNLSLRMGVRRFTRITNGFRKKWESHCTAVMLWYCWYNFGRVHKSLRMTPAMAAGIADHIWSVLELLEAA